MEKVTGFDPQTGRNYPANYEWVLTNQEGSIVKTGQEVEEIQAEPIVNAEGQTHSEWKRDLSRREWEEAVGGLAEFATDGLGFVLLGAVQVVIFVVKLPWLLAVKLSEHEERYSSSGRHHVVNDRPKVNVNVEVNGQADVNVNVKVNQ